MYTIVFMVGSFPNMNSAKYQFFPKHLFDAFPIQWETEHTLIYKTSCLLVQDSKVWTPYI